MRTLSTRLVAFIFIAISAWWTGAGAQILPQPTVRTEQVQATLLAHAPQGVPVGLAADAAAAQPVWVGLQITHAPDWHTYWKNAGDSGMPTELQWTLPPGVTAGDIAWPLPRKIPIGHLANYGYEGTVLLPVPLTITPDYQPGPLAKSLDVRLKATWLVCRKECIPQEGDFAIQLPLHSSTALNGAAFDAALKAQPAEVRGDHRIELTEGGKRLAVRVAGLPDSVRGQALELFPETPNVVVTAATSAAPGQPLDDRTWRQRWDGAVWTADVPVAADRADSPARMPLVLVTADGQQGWRADAPVAGTWPALAQAAVVSPALEAALKANAAQAGASAAPSSAASMVNAVPLPTFLLALLGALLGGVVLNLMPCVFPVLAIKVLGFTQHADDRRAHRTSGLAYTAGVVLSFLALGALMLALRAAGQQLGWGFQLQSPAVVAALTVLFTVIGLNLAGVFEFGSFLPSRVATLEARNPVANSFLTGMLAVAVASPCTAPFMGASLGLAVGLPAVQALLIFAAIGLGMALPYLAASWWPAVARLLPRPGAWMDTFKKFMAFPMFGTAVWLLWVLGQQTGIDGAGALLALLVALALVLWALGLRGRTRLVIASLSIAVGALLASAIGPNIVKTAESAPLADAAGTRWQPWSAERVQTALGAGQPVFVDFTAAWCVTCQYNKKTTLADADVLAALDAAKVQTFRADWTRRDAAITAELTRLGRSGVPVYLLQSPGQPPRVLSEILSVADVLGALKTMTPAR
ncbi:protein-disulfide reductase DsbD family protein [Ottowia sp. SB7-C50]|uniref:protein-disulfide reductase DsbD family protein n=1 Tax=Ottowia sp. SB7-C50 TaxID=3081231 RepID=UPI00295315B4|nr:protein-disulfide reductase DsbD domain-containing protein [Ottowia sp. SB7-C50]WOP15987.1 protein-disulfide reductase DsbD family protein [Ottowia sp. SB7-C50]